MRLVDHSFASPAENLALDEVLLEQAESVGTGEVLRLWESPEHFVVLGLSQDLETHAHREACARDGVAILRRCSAGGCVLQGPGCLNFTLVLRTDRPGCGGIRSSYATILNSLASELNKLGVPAALEGTSDLATDGVKFSGNAQRRRKKFFLHHGTLLYGMNLALCARYLREPSERPSYRGLRDHQAFLRNLPVGATSLRAALRTLFNTGPVTSLSDAELSGVGRLAEQKYLRAEWNEGR